MADLCVVVYSNSAIKDVLTRRLDMHFRNFISTNCDGFLDLLKYMPITMWPTVVFIEWQEEERAKIEQIIEKLVSSTSIRIYVIGPENIPISGNSIDDRKLLRIIDLTNLQQTDISALLGLTGQPITCGTIALWPSLGIVFNGDGLPGESLNLMSYLS